MRDISKNIRDLRRLKGMTQEELAEKLFVTRQTISNYEQGRTRPDIDMLVRIAEILETDANTVLYGVQEKDGKKITIIKVCVWCALAVLSLALYAKLFDLVIEYKRNTFIARPVYWVTVFGKPLTFYVLGWAVMEVLGATTRLQPFRNPKCKWIRLWLWAMVLLYFVLMLPYTLLDAWPWSIPRFWQNAAYMLLDALPDRTNVFDNGFWAFVIAMGHWLFRAGKKQD